MKFKLYGKILTRSVRKVTKSDKTTYELYEITVEEPGQFPSVFKLSSKDASLFGQKDGPFAVGKMVSAEGFINGSERDAKTKDGKPFKTYNVWFTLTALTPAQDAASAESPAADDGVAEDIPF